MFPNVGKKGCNMLIPKSQLGYFNLHLATAANSNGSAVDVWTPEGGSYTTLTLQVSGLIVAAVELQGSVDGSSFFPILAENLTTGVESHALTPGLFRALVVGLRQVRVVVSDYSSGNITVVAAAVA